MLHCLRSSAQNAKQARARELLSIDAMEHNDERQKEMGGTPFYQCNMAQRPEDNEKKGRKKRTR